jgi:hypothetical protein
VGDYIKELRRLGRTIDMMLTMHSVLRDRYKRKALIVDIVLFIASSLLLFASIVDLNLLSRLRLPVQDLSIFLKACSVVIFISSLVILRVDWKEQATKHGRACEALARLKSETRAVLLSDNSAIENYTKHQQLCSLTMNNLWPIPEKQFHKLKALHFKKIELSKLISSHPGCPLWALRIGLFFRAVFEACRKDKKDKETPPEQQVDE